MSDGEYNSDRDEGATDINENPRDSDVLCGRGGAALRHPGNQTYRRLVHLNKGLYITCLKAEKLKISRSIVAAIREQNGRFLERDTKKSTWYDIGDRKAMEKTSQALREGQPKLRQKIVELGGGAAGAAALLESQFPGGQIYNLQQQPGSASSIHANNQMAQALDMNAHIEQQIQNEQQNYLDQQSQMHGLMPPPHSRNDFNANDLLHRLSLSEIQEEPSFHHNQFSTMRHQTSAEAAELAVAESTYSLMSDYSNYGMTESQINFDAQHRAAIINAIGQQKNNNHIPGPPEDYTPGSLSIGSVGSGVCGLDGNSNQQQSRASLPKLDRRKHFAVMKYSRPASGRFTSGSSKNLFNSQRSLGADGMPDIHLVESNPSLLSNTSGGSDRPEINGAKIPDVANIFESRRSMMSGLSRISDASEVNSIFSDLSRKIGNISTRSIAMSEMSNMDDHGDIDNFSTDTEKLHPNVTNQQMHLDYE